MTVDRYILPVLMREIESHLAFLGRAYRQGGDEYICIAPGLSNDFGVLFFEELRRRIASLNYGKQSECVTTVSIGLYVADSDCHFTNHEILVQANLAKKKAKESGKNKVVLDIPS